MNKGMVTTGIMSDDLFSIVKSSVKISDYVRDLPQTKGMHSVGPGRYRCNNVIAGGSNPDSMIIDDNAGFFKVFSHDQQGGDVITLYSLINGSSSLPDAARDLAHDRGITVPERTGNSSSLHSVMNAVRDAAHHRLVTSTAPDAQAARDYLESRGMDEDMRDDWMLGVLPSDPRKARALLSSCGDEDSLRKTGMYGGKRGDFISMSGRLLFPIASLSGSCISFSSRVIPGVDTPLPDSKYVNTSSTPIYSKQNTLYGQHLLRGKKILRVIICEGNFDVLALNAATAEDTVAVATCGTALTEGHVSILTRYTRQAVLMFDSDAAGRKAAAGSLWVCNHFDAPRIAILDGKDPWDCYVEDDLSGVRTAPMIDQAVITMCADLSRHDFLTWYSHARSSLNFSEDRERLETVASEKAGIVRSALPGSISSSVSRYRPDPAPEGEVSTTAISLCRALMCVPLRTRRAIAFPLFSAKMREEALQICGLDTESDAFCINAVLNDTEHPLMSELLPEHENDSYRDVLCGDIARMIAMKILAEWSKDMPDDVDGYLTALSVCASSSTRLDHLVFVFDMLGVTCISR